ncbi:uncharacterized protein LOC143194081 [Rhynchophorus ferrugineus]|uniref:uncharacterized protein LOC143194081 n=1 Tax=Rhynchophorus ferrugineus TaxID=354439 RepID=UPI003FCCC7ED
MILQPCNVELTKVYYYDINKRSQNVSISTVSGKKFENSINEYSIIKNNIFGQRWLLKINEFEDIRKESIFNLKICAYAFVFFTLLLAIGFGIFYSFDNNIFKSANKYKDNENIKKYFHKIHTTSSSFNATTSNKFPNEKLNLLQNENLQQVSKRSTFYCKNCSSSEICLKIEETVKPQCVAAIDKKDPTGCGGLCKLNTEYCKNLDKLNGVFQCFPLKTLLKCPDETFNCGDMCVTTKKRCDGNKDCFDLVDEKNCVCNLETHFHCGNGTSCLEKERLCDGKVDCWDKTDETECQWNDL